ncbi:PH domain-containing protein [Patescibacteria group bacterium]|nr:MAG: PH domain-containing protein [Patescibacteria group bacterium]
MERFTLRPNEKVLQHARRHAVMVVVPLGFLFGLLLLDAFFMSQLFRLGVFGGIIFVLVAGFCLIAALRAWLLWVSNVFLVTTHRVIDVDRHGFFEWTVSEADLDRIQDISVHKHGLLDYAFRTGAIEIQTAGSSAILEIGHVPHPFALRARITEAQDAVRRQLDAASESLPDLDRRMKDLAPEDRRAVAKYVDHLRSRKAFADFSSETEGDDQG